MNVKQLIIFIAIIIFSLGLLSCNSARSMVNDRLKENIPMQNSFGKLGKGLTDYSWGQGARAAGMNLHLVE